MKFTSFQVCRVCLLPEGFTKLSSLFEGDAGNATKFAAVCDIDIFKDLEKHNAMICGECLRELENTFKFRSKARRSEVAYFEHCRVEHKRKMTSDKAGSIEDGSGEKSDGKSNKNDERSTEDGKAGKSKEKSKKNNGKSSKEEQTAFVNAFAKEISKAKLNISESPSTDSDSKNMEPPVKKKKTVTFAKPEVKEVRQFERENSHESQVQVPVDTKKKKRRGQTARKRSANRCLQCTKTFVSNASLQSHILRIHPKDK